MPVMDINRDQLLKSCKEVLDENRRGNYTIPSKKLYPHQWLWDSCFTAIGLRHYDASRAQNELVSLLRGQWSNGMLPNMIFSSDWHYGLERYFWDSKRNLDSPKTVATSGITQPPMLAEAVVRVGQKLSLAQRQDWYKQMLPALIKYHQWLYAERDPDKNGLVFQIHPYETGLDNTPPWVEELHAFHKPWWLPLFKKLPIDWLINLLRRDIRQGNKHQRISNIDALLYIDIILRMRRKDYLINEIIENDKFLIEDLTFNCILIRANKHLQQIADSIRHKLPSELTELIEQNRQALEKLWDDQAKEYYSRSYSSERLIKTSTIASLMPLYSGAISHTRAKQLVEKLHDADSFGTNFPVPSVPLNSRWFNAQKYWQGPTWLNTNWLIIQGLLDYGFNKEAKLIKEKTLELVSRHGNYEYFSPTNGNPAGASNFSWTAALVIDFLEN